MQWRPRSPRVQILAQGRTEMRRAIIIGEAPSRIGDPDKPLSGRCGARLCKLMGMPKYDYEQLAEEFELVNLLQEHQRLPITGRGHAYDLPAAILSARRMRAQGIFDERLTIFLGKRVARAVLERYRIPSYFMQCSSHRVQQPATYVVVPHPSGVNHYWNDPGSVRKASEWWRSLRNNYKELRKA